MKRTIKYVVFCVSVQGSSIQTFMVQQHTQISKHRPNKQRYSKEKYFLTQPTSDGMSKFKIDLCFPLISVEILLYKLKTELIYPIYEGWGFSYGNYLPQI